MIYAILLWPTHSVCFTRHETHSQLFRQMSSSLCTDSILEPTTKKFPTFFATGCFCNKRFCRCWGMFSIRNVGFCLLFLQSECASNSFPKPPILFRSLSCFVLDSCCATEIDYQLQSQPAWAVCSHSESEERMLLRVVDLPFCLNCYTIEQEGPPIPFLPSQEVTVVVPETNQFLLFRFPKLLEDGNVYKTRGKVKWHETLIGKTRKLTISETECWWG